MNSIVRNEQAAVLVRDPRIRDDRFAVAAKCLSAAILGKLLLVVLGCTTDSPPECASLPDASTVGPGATAEAKPRTGGWHDQLGDTVPLTGEAVNWKVGAFLDCGEFGIFVDLPETHWPAGLYRGGDEGERVRVTGTVAQRSDLPVFIPDPDRPIPQGIPVPKGTDLDEAAKRYILESVQWERVGGGTE